MTGRGELAGPGPSRLHVDLAGRILRLLKEEGAGNGRRLVELELCEAFGVSRTPIRGALRLLAARGAIEARPHRGFVLKAAVTQFPPAEAADAREEEDRRLFVDIARARNEGRLPAQCSQQRLAAMFTARLSTVGRVLRQLATMGLAERQPGNAWSFAPSLESGPAERESYAFREVIEPAALLLPGYKLDRAWATASRGRHLAFTQRAWRGTLAVDFFKVTSDFHEQLAAASGNRYMLSAMQQQNRLRAFLNYDWVLGVERVRATVAEHLAILDALELGKSEEAAALMRSHLIHSQSGGPPAR